MQHRCLRERISIMKENFSKKRIILFMLLLGAMFILSSCYMTPPDDISGMDVNNVMGGTYVAYTTPPPTQPPTPAPELTPAPPTNTPDPWSGNNPFVPTAPANQGGTLPQTSTLPTSPPASTIGTVPTSPPATRTASPTSRPTATPQPTASSLKVGSTGDAVKKMQSRLKELGYYTGSVDGNFGSNTESAVKDFQRSHGLSTDGKAGRDTMNKMNSSSAKKKTTATPTPRVTPTPRPTPTPDLSKETYYKIGASGKAISQLQGRLIQLGYLTGKADGSYGYRTEAAIKAFQKRAGVWDDGIAGPDTQRALYGNNAKKANSVVAHIGDPLKEGAKSAGVRSMQKLLAELGYLRSGEADGAYGQNTKNAVMYFQQRNGLTPVDGAAGDKTLELLYSGNAVRSDGSGGGGGDDISSDGYTVLRPGEATGPAVKKLQDALRGFDYYTGSSDGKYGSGTTEAVRTFQLRNGIKVDGVAGPVTQRLLYGDTGVNPNKFTPLRPNEKGQAVRTMQSTLAELNYYQGSIDGSYGVTTENAVREFQKNNGLKVDGTAGRDTLAIMFSSYAKGASKTTVKYNILRPGDSGEEVAVLQDRLMRLGYYTLSVNAQYDPYTKSAVEDFQARHGLKKDGIAGEDTQSILFSNSAKKK